MFIPEERRQYINWIKHNRKLYAAGEMKEERVERFCKHVNLYV